MFFTTVMYLLLSFFFFFNDTATTEIYTLSLHDALPILTAHDAFDRQRFCFAHNHRAPGQLITERSEEHTSELQSQSNLVCRLLLEKKKRDSQKARRSQSHGSAHSHQHTLACTSRPANAA